MDDLNDRDKIRFSQSNYLLLVGEYGRDEAKKIIASRLRELADIVESDGYPDVFGWVDAGKPGPIASYILTLSYPWGG
jgi:hypothetical protein